MLYNLLYKIYFVKFNNSFLDKYYKVNSIRICNIIFPILFRLPIYKRNKPSNLNTSKNEYVVSLTTFPARIKNVWLTIETILRQTEKPYKIILWLYRGEFNGKKSLPKELLRLEKRGLEIRFCNENLMPHKKYFYSMLEFPNSNIITIDDDVYYPLNLIKKLSDFHKKYPCSILSPFSRKINIANNKTTPYEKWNYMSNNSKPTLSILPIGVGSVLYPPKALHKEVFNKKELKKLALEADDLWLKVMSIKQGTKVTSMAGEYQRHFIPVIITNNKSLMDDNIDKGNNDRIFNSLIDNYQIPINIYDD